jgi:hypothetical protein
MPYFSQMGNKQLGKKFEEHFNINHGTLEKYDFNLS